MLVTFLRAPSPAMCPFTAVVGIPEATLPGNGDPVVVPLDVLAIERQLEALASHS